MIAKPYGRPATSALRDHRACPKSRGRLARGAPERDALVVALHLALDQRATAAAGAPGSAVHIVLLALRIEPVVGLRPPADVRRDQPLGERHQRGSDRDLADALPRPDPAEEQQPPTCRGCRCRRGSAGRAARPRSPGRARASIRRTASAGSQSVPSRSGPRCASSAGSSAVGISAARAGEADCRTVAVVSTTRIVWAGRPCRRSPGWNVRQVPSMRRCEWSVGSVPVSLRSRSSRCLPRLTHSMIRQPLRLTVASAGTRKSERSIDLAGERFGQRVGGVADGVAFRHTRSPGDAGRMRRVTADRGAPDRPARRPARRPRVRR